MIILLLCGLFLIFLSAFMLIRNNWVYDERVKLMHRNMDDYNSLPSYNRMFFEFWVWDIERFIE